jgi:signal transduction histidine kinase
MSARPFGHLRYALKRYPQPAPRVCNFAQTADDGRSQAGTNRDAWRPPQGFPVDSPKRGSAASCARLRSETRGVDDRSRERGPAGKAREPFRASALLAPKQVVEVDTVSVQQETVEFKHFIEQLCEDLSGMLCDGNAARSIAVEGVDIVIPTQLGIPLGFIVNELITNAAKHAQGEITVRLETTPELGHCLSVSDDGMGLPDGFRPSRARGLGLEIVQSLVRQINGRLQIGLGAGRHGACFKVFFPSTTSSAIDRAGENPHEQEAPWISGA